MVTINDSITPQDAARLQAFMGKLDLSKPSVDRQNDRVYLRWVTTRGTVVEAAAMWFPMLLACWIHIDRTLESSDIAHARFFEETP